MRIKYPEDDFVILDFETTGFSPINDRITEVGALWISGGQIRDTFSKLITQQNPLPEHIIQLTGITDQMLQDEGEKEENVLWELKGFLTGRPVLGHNLINFDQHFLNEGLKRYQISLESPLNMLDTAALYKARKLGLTPFWYENHLEFAKRILNLRIPGVKYNLALCMQENEIVLDSPAHRAISDCLGVYEIYKCFLKAQNEA